MKSFLLVLLGIVIGAVAGVLVLSPFFTAVGAGVGIATGLKAGACLTVEGAKSEGLISDDQVDEVLRAAVAQISASELPSETGDGEAELDCAQVVADLKAAASE